MSSGASVNAECLSKFQELKTGKKIKYIIFGMNADNSEIIVLKESTDQSYDKFLEELPESECRWAVYDMEFDSGEGIRNKLCFYMWTPDGAKIKPKMVYAASKDALRKGLVGISTGPSRPFSPNQPSPGAAGPLCASQADHHIHRVRPTRLCPVRTEIQGTDYDEVSEQSVLEKVKRK